MVSASSCSSHPAATYSTSPESWPNPTANGYKKSSPEVEGERMLENLLKVSIVGVYFSTVSSGHASLC